MSEQQWIVVCSKRKHIKKEKSSKKKEGRIIWELGKPIYEEENSEHDVESFLKSNAFAANRQKIESKINHRLQEDGKCKIAIECLGLGDFMKHAKPRFQFYFLKYLLIPLCQGYQNPPVKVNSYDPIFSPQCIEEMSKIATCDEKSTFEDGQQLCIYFMPHCQRFLYQKICRQLPQSSSIVIGNSILDYCSRCQLIQEEIPLIFQERTEKLQEEKLMDFRESLNDTFVYFV